MTYIYGSVTINNGTRFRARQEADAVTYMTHRGFQRASTKIAKTFRAGDSSVSPSNRYQFPDEMLNEHKSHASSNNVRWRQH